MFINDRLVYLEMQKTASQHIDFLLDKYVGGRQLGHHTQLVGDHAERFTIGSVRNPWDWYVSLWAYGCLGKGSLHEALTGGRIVRLKQAASDLKPFPMRLLGKAAGLIGEQRREAWQSVYADAGEPRLFRQWLKDILGGPAQADMIEGYPQSSLSRFAGFMTFRYVRLYVRYGAWRKSILTIRDENQLADLLSAHGVLDHAIRMECLEEDFIEALRLAGYEVDATMSAAIHDEKKQGTNKSKHNDADFYYDRETADLVADRDRLIINLYGYNNPLEPRESATGESRRCSAA